MDRLTDRERLILLNLIPEIGSTRLRRLLDAFGDLERVWSASGQTLEQVEGIGPGLARRLVGGRHDAPALERELALAERAGINIVTLEEADYPAALRTISDPPLALYIRGSLSLMDEVAVAIVGARRASLYGIQCAEQLGYELALRGVTVISGLARGIDAAAHRGALKASGRTLAVLGSGLACLYPPEHQSLADEIVQHGALVSEYPMMTPPLPHNFPRRNRIISGFSLGVVIVEAAQRSGALITADCALEQGREVFAVPGPMTSVTSQGTHQLLKQGARLVTSVEDILEELRLSPQPVTSTAAADDTTATKRLGDDEQRVLACVDNHEPTHIDAIAGQSGMALPELSALLLRLELKRVIRQVPGQQFIKMHVQACEVAGYAGDGQR